MAVVEVVVVVEHTHKPRGFGRDERRLWQMINWRVLKFKPKGIERHFVV